MRSVGHSVRRAIAGVLLGAAAASLLFPSPPPAAGDSSVVASQKKKKKRRTAPQATMVTRWLQRDVETAQRRAADGDLSKAGQLYRSLARDGMLLGLMGTRSGGLVRLPKRFSGCPAGVAYLQGANGRRGHFDRIFPSAELAKLARDGFALGVGVAELIETCAGAVLVRLDPEFLVYRWWEDRWYYRSACGGLEPITPGDGRWILHTPGGRQDPWDHGSWAALARAYISKEHALFYRENWNSKLAHPARVATAPLGASEEQAQSWFRKVMAWGINTVFGLKPGYEVKLLESNGRGYESFRETIADSNQEFMVSVAGQVVTTTGGVGFANADIHATIRGDLIEGDGMSLAATICEQALPHVLVGVIPEGERVDFEWDTRPAMNRKDEASALSAAAQAIQELVAALVPHGLRPDVRELALRFGVPLQLAEQIVANAQPSNDIEVDVVFDEEGEPCGPEDAIGLTDEAIETIASQMTDLGAGTCRHGRPNRCWICGVERVDTPYRADDGSVAWAVTWRPIPQQAAA